MTEKQTQETKQKDDDKITVKYVGDSPGAIVSGFSDGKGYYEKKGSQRTYSEPDEIELAKRLVETNSNFKEVGN